MTHAATLITMRNLSNPTTKQLTALFEAVKPYLSGARGATNVEEFVAEAFGNARFAQELATINIQGEPASAWQKFTNIIGNFIRRLRGLDPVKLAILQPIKIALLSVGAVYIVTAVVPTSVAVLLIKLVAIALS